MQNKVLQRPMPNASLPRNGFDRGFEMKYNFSSGMALPVFCEPVIGQTKMRINRRSIFRAAQLQTAAMVRNSYNIDFFFVPFRQLWSYYGFARTGTRDYNSSKMALNPNVTLLNLPRFAASDGTTVDHDLLKMLSYLHSVSSSDSNPDIHGFPADRGCERLLDLLNYGFNVSYDTAQEVEYSQRINTWPALSPFKLCAYQKVWYDHYRLTNYVPNVPKAYNLDNLLNNDGTTNPIFSEQLAAMGTMHYVPYRKDYFQNVYPSLNYASMNQMAPLYFKVPNNVAGAQLNFVRQTSDVTFSSSTTVGQPSGYEQGSANVPLVNMSANPATSMALLGSSFSAQTIRALFALDKMTRLAAYAPKHVADQFEARFGFRPKGEDINESVRIGSFVSDISIGEVVSTADLSDSPLGAIGGRAYSIANFEKDIEYTAPEDGIIIGIGYALPRISYDAGGIDDFNTIIDTASLPQPEFMDLGLQPLRRRELYWLSKNYGVLNNQELNNRLIGYQPMYSAWKIGKDRNHGLFINGKQFGMFSTHTKVDYTDLGAGQSPAFVSIADGVDARYFYADPRDLNQIFASSYDGTQLTDQFYGMIEFKFDVVQNFSIHGQPKI